jgi:light-regulated signal transduction histidine kinase (bacteriophytochrome)
MNKPVINILHGETEEVEKIKKILSLHGYDTDINLTYDNKYSHPFIQNPENDNHYELPRTLYEKASSVNNELDNFAYIASHDLQEPLRMVSSYVRLLQKKYSGKLDKDADEYINFAVDGVKRMKLLLDDLLAYSRMNNHQCIFSQIDSSDLIEEIFLRIKKSFSNCDFKIKGQLPIINADRELISRLIEHLLVNAVKFNHSKVPTAEVACDTNEHDWVFYIRDNGIGIDEIYKERIFNVFQKLHNNSDYSGSGIGLALCKKIISLHKGKIWVESIPGTGSTFLFSVPMQ